MRQGGGRAITRTFNFSTDNMQSFNLDELFMRMDEENFIQHLMSNNPFINNRIGRGPPGGEARIHLNTVGTRNANPNHRFEIVNIRSLRDLGDLEREDPNDLINISDLRRDRAGLDIDENDSNSGSGSPRARDDRIRTFFG